jgi:hypothetical protein
MSDGALMAKAAREEFSAIDFTGVGASAGEQIKGTLY